MVDSDKEITNAQIYSLLSKVERQNRDIKEDIELLKHSVTQQNQKLKSIENDVVRLRAENTQLRRSTEALERKVRERNVAVFGIDSMKHDVLVDYIIKLFGEKLDITLKPENIGNIYYKGKKENTNRPVILNLTHYSLKQSILRASKGLKGTGVFVANDLTVEQQKEQKVLYGNYKLAKSRNYPARLTREAVIINGKKYRCTDLQETPLPNTPVAQSLPKNLDRVSVSAPTSPNAAEDSVFLFDKHVTEHPSTVAQGAESLEIQKKLPPRVTRQMSSEVDDIGKLSTGTIPRSRSDSKSKLKTTKK